MRVEFDIIIVVFEVLKEEDCETARAVSELIILRLIDNATKRSISMWIRRIRERRKEFRTGLVRIEVVKIRSRLDRSLKELESTSMLNEIRYSYELTISSLYK